MKKSQSAASGDRFFISAWGGSFNLPRTEEYYQSLQEAAFTHVTMAEESELSAAAAHGLKLIVKLQDPVFEKPRATEKQLRAACRELYNRIGNHPAFAGYFLKDEPAVEKFPRIAMLRKLFREIDPAHESYINLNSIFATPAIMGAPNYQEYLDRYVAETAPDYLGYDLYCLYRHKEDIVQEDFWTNLAMIRRAASARQIPFRFVLLSAAHFDFRIPSEDDLNFQAFSAIAYGAKGIEYFTYTDPDVSIFQGSPLDGFGCKTPTWYAAASVNKRIQVLAPVLNKLQSTSVYHFSQTDRAPTNSAPPAEALVRANPGREMLVGEFRHAETGDRYLLLVNTDLLHTVKAELVLPAGMEGYRLSQYTPGEMYLFDKSQTWMTPGGASLIKVVAKKKTPKKK